MRIGAEADNDLVLAHPSVSGHHAEIRQSNGRCSVRDLGSTNGTFLNGQRIRTEQAVRAGDKLRFGAARFAMVAVAKPAPSRSRYVSLVLGLLVLAAVGFLTVLFVGNWEKVEELSTTPKLVSIAPPTASIGESPRAASTASSEPLGVKLPPSIEAMASAVASTAALVAPPAWLAAINKYRASVKLAPVAEDPKLSDADRKHAKYVVKNYEDKVSAGHLIGSEMHDEEKGNPWYTPEGAAAGTQSNVNQLWGHDSPPSIRWALDNWMAGPFHRLWILNPRLQRVGYGEFCEKKYCVAALDLGDAIESSHEASALKVPIEFPADKSSTAMNSFSGEWPSPLTSCPGYNFPAGLPATIQLGGAVPAKLTEYQITRDGHGLESCGIDAASYQNPVAADQDRGRAILREAGAAIIVPRYPLRPGHYSVTATINDHAYQWSFTVTASSAASMPLATDESEAKAPAASAKSDSAEREAYEHYISDGKATAAAVAVRKAKAADVAAINKAKFVAIEALNRETRRKEQTAFPDGPGAVATVGAGQWLTELNRDRAAVGQPPVVEDPAMSEGNLKHSRYLVMNYPTPVMLGAEMHKEDPSKPGSTPEGIEAAKSNVSPAWYGTSTQPRPPMGQLRFINGWLVTPFHRPGLLSPDLHKVGFGEFCEGRACAAGLDTPGSMPAVRDPRPYPQPILFPPAKYPIALNDMSNEWPDPITACPGYKSPVGTPITIELGLRVDARLSDYALAHDSKPLEVCGFDAKTYVNPSASDQEHARSGLSYFGEVVILPRQPLERGATYDVSATVNDHPYRWSFTVSR